jgi:hypothetical protein
MGPRDWFSVGVRLFALWVIYDGVTYLMAVFANRLVYFTQPDAITGFNAPQHTLTDYAVYSVGALCGGFALLVKAEELTRWAFKEPPPTRDAAAIEE